MPKIPIDELRALWQAEGFWGPWRERLREGHSAAPTSFEFGILPEEQDKYGDFRIVLDHCVFVRLCPLGNLFRGPFVIRPDVYKAGTAEEENGWRTFYVTPDEYSSMLSDARQIFEEYRDEERVCFWSIPNQWFEDLPLIRFITEKIVDTPVYRNLPRPRDTWFWP